MVQGVGFRPFVYRTAVRLGLTGKVSNTPGGVLIDVEGPPEAVEAFQQQLRQDPPPLARIRDIRSHVLPPAGYDRFEIAPSARGRAGAALVPPDVAICPDCRRELLDPSDRRFSYPFINCTNCGPRFTIVRGLPYDRERTTMAAFAMCAACSREYHDPADRRFHAQPTACPECGPHVWWVGPAEGRPPGRAADGHGHDWMAAFRQAILAGQTVAVKGLGGFHLACDALDAEAVQRLRRRKHRPRKPFAIMAKDLATVRRLCEVNEVEARLLCSSAAPIVLLRRRPDAPLPEALAPGLRTLGVMLPYTPLHVLLFQAVPEREVLVMTSGNRSSLPIVKDNESALAELGDIADAFVLHDREIANRADDSVVQVVGEAAQFLRRSRGFVPAPIPVPVPRRWQGEPAAHPVVLGAGGDMKNACCLIKGGQAFMGPHTGELETVEAEAFWRHNVESMSRLLDVWPEVAGVDLHPGYRSRRLGASLVGRVHGIQHHHAHLVAALAENGRTGPAVGIVLDGTGYGTDGTLWGGEILLGGLASCRRLMHLRYIRLPGGERAIRRPWLLTLSCLCEELGVEQGLSLARALFPQMRRDLELAVRVLTSGFNSPRSCGAGRLFDAVAAATGTCLEATYEGEPALVLSELAREELEAREPGGAGGDGYAARDRGSGGGPYPYRVRPPEIDLLPAVVAAARDRLSGAGAAVVAARWHRTVEDAMVQAAQRACLREGVRVVALSGGVFHNPYLVQAVARRLEAAGVEVLTHREVPPGDGGLALGQAVCALWREAEGAATRSR
ncbi:MAG: carbamoyltransferase HypF [Limnochordaceae bacterium]|nr:carbamoyltransferase HypF [Limnochordaceae bacterium]